MTATKRNYQQELDAVLASLPPFDGNAQRPTLLLHACCAPCSSYVIEYLARHFAITLYYYNPNIHPQTEYERRLGELARFVARFPPATQGAVQLVTANYNAEEYFAATGVYAEPTLQTEAERGERCRRCYRLRMTYAYAYARANSFDWFTTTLSISPHKDAASINTIGEALQTSADAPGTKYLPADFKKRGGFLRSTQLSAEYGLWRQDYCGCVFSLRQREAQHIHSPATTER